ncbi:hypothetical protein [Streptomyces sp. NPDC046712]|uniref:hypothetical protein n=1 Tax=Streptomyces sp. NPDC046712 TaxID=3154802 RepID=UPI0033CAE60F
MERYGTSDVPDPFACTMEGVKSLAARLSARETAELDHAAVEHLIEVDGREILRRFFQDHLDLRAVREEQHPPSEPVLGAAGEKRPYRERGHERQLTCLFGKVTVTRCPWRRRGRANVHPADAQLSLPRGRHSHGIKRLAVRARRRKATIHILIDFVHVAEYVWTAAHAFHRVGSEAAETFAAEKLTAILHGHAARITREMTTQAEKEQLTGSKREAVDTCVRYLTGHLARLRYHIALKNGWPIATGSVEGACRHLVGDRLDVTGAHWGLDSAEAVLKLRAVHANGDLDDYLTYHHTREHQRTYPDQRDYQLGA